jgi:hypothetical protein
VHLLLHLLDIARGGEYGLGRAFDFRATAAALPRSCARSGKSKPVVWTWQARFMAEGVEGLLRDKTRTADPKRVLAAVKRGKEKLESIH